MQTETVDGRGVPFVVRVESATINRGIVRIGVLDDPAARGPDAPFDAVNWSHRVFHAFGESCGVGYQQGVNDPTFVLGGAPDPTTVSADRLLINLAGGIDRLAKGDAVLHSTLAAFGVHCNPLISAESTMMIKEHITEAYGLVDFYVGTNGSGAALQQYNLGNNFPGVLSAAMPTATFADIVTTAMTVTDCGLLRHYYANSSLDWNDQKQAAVDGHLPAPTLPEDNPSGITNPGICQSWTDAFFNRVDPDAACPGALPEELRYNAETNPGGARCTIQDANVNIFGRDPATGFARRPLDNVGVQYGLEALTNGDISAEEFLDLNRNIGGLDIDGNFVSERHVMDGKTEAVTYRIGGVIGRGALAETPVMDFAPYLDLVPVANIHEAVRPFIVRARIEKQTGQHVTQAIWRGVVTQPDGYPVMEQWLTALKDARPAPGGDHIQAVMATKPADAQDSCVFATVGGRFEFPDALQGPLGFFTVPFVPGAPLPDADVPLRVTVPEDFGPSGREGIGPCTLGLPVTRTPRMVAGMPLTDDIIKCQLKPINPADYNGALSEAQLAELGEIFPDGVCDYSQPAKGDVEQSMLYPSVGGATLEARTNSSGGWRARPDNSIRERELVMASRSITLAGSVLIVLGLAACGSGDSDGFIAGPGGSGSFSPSASNRYTLANGCFALKSLARNAYAVHGADGSYAATAPDKTAAEALFMKPTALGNYLFHAEDQSLLAVSGASVGSAGAPSDATNWTVDKDANGAFSIVSESADKALAVDNAGKLVLADAASAGNTAKFGFATTIGCTPYPEMPVDVEGETYKGRGVDKPVIGFAEVHTHMAMSHEMSDGSRSVGPSAGGTLYGQMFNRFGAPEALKNCEAWHGPNGIHDADNIIHANPTAQHDTQGWPSFVDWPSAPSLTHQGMYYKWVERAWKAGLRILVSHGTNIDSLCQVGRTYVATLRPEATGYDCDDMSLGFKQDQYLYELQDYVDAQQGGPGQGWFRIVKSPQEARVVINDGKLAVVPGLEFSHIFNCQLTVNPDGSETSGCDEAEIDRQIERIYDLGVRQLFPFHDVNSSLGGTGIFNGDVINGLNFLDTRQFWKTYDCPETGEGEAYFYNAGAIMTTAVPGTGSDPVSSAVIAALQGPAPTYPPDKRQCNARGLTELGRYALQRLMEKKFVIDIDHAELSIKQDMIDMAKAQNPPYPLSSNHGGHGGISTQQARDILSLGGLIYPYKPNGKGMVEFLQRLKVIAPPNFLFAVGYGSDVNGFGGLAGPRGAGSEPVQYPFTLFQGPGWGPQFAGIAPISVDLLTIPESGKFWNVDEVGMAHYGLVADYIEEVRLEGGQEALTALYNSAEAYLQMWERTVNR